MGGYFLNRFPLPKEMFNAPGPTVREDRRIKLQLVAAVTKSGLFAPNCPDPVRMKATITSGHPSKVRRQGLSIVETIVILVELGFLTRRGYAKVISILFSFFFTNIDNYYKVYVFIFATSKMEVIEIGRRISISRLTISCSRPKT